MNIEFRPVVGYEGLYEVSNTGIVRSLDRVARAGKGMCLYKGRQLKPGIGATKYAHVILCKDGINKVFLVHRLVAMAFLPTEDYSLNVNHIDGVKTNNNVSNLEWCSFKDNIAHAVATGLRANLYGVKNHRSRSVRMLTLDGTSIRTFDTIRDVQSFLGLEKQATGVTDCCRGRYKSSYGYKWEYVEEV